MKGDLIVLKLDKARLLLAEARDATDAKKVADLAHAAEIYAKRQKLSQEAINYATMVKVDALTLMGEFLIHGPKNNGTKGQLRGKQPSGGSLVVPPEKNAPTQEELLGKGGRKVASTAKGLATLKKADPETHEQVRQGKLSAAQGARRVQRQRKRQELERQAAQANGRANTGWQITQGDCLEVMPSLTEKPRLIFADPPYNIGIDYGDGTRADRLPAAAYMLWASSWIKMCHELLSADGSLWVMIGDEYAARYWLALEANGFTVRNWIKWYETFGVNCTNNFNRCSRHLFYCVKDPKRFTFNAAAVNRASDRQTKYGDKRADPAGKIWDDVWIIPRLVGTAKERIPDFPTQLPLALVRPIIGACSNPGDLVLDPFCGSATTGVAAVELGRNFIGIEKSAHFADLATKRMKVLGNQTHP
jgi:site-specific DNA-methyltransferase (adenine-specific)